MEIKKGWLSDAKQLELKHIGKKYQPNKIILHYTATDTLKKAVSALNSNTLSYHVLIEPDGTAHQTRPFLKHAAHAGRSNWKQLKDLRNISSQNREAISISFINRGFFSKRSGDQYYDANAHGNPIGKTYSASEVTTKNSIYHPTKKRFWHNYTVPQLATCETILFALISEYDDIKEIVGHDDVAIDAKFDTGPLFPMEKLRQETGKQGGLGLKCRVKSPDGVLTLRQRPQKNSKALDHLNNGDIVYIRSVVYSYNKKKAIVVDKPKKRYLTRWASVDIDGKNHHSGYMYMKFLTKTPLIKSLENKL